MADTYEQNLAQKSTLTTSDYIRVVGSDNVSYKQSVESVLTSGIAINATASTADLNTIYANQANNTVVLISGQNEANQATTTGVVHAVISHRRDANYGTQWEFIYTGTATNRGIYYRRIQGGTWSDWEQLPTRAEVDALGQKFSITTSGQTFTIASGYRGILYITDSSTPRCGEYFVISTGAGVVSYKAVSSASDITLTAGTNSLTLTPTSGSRVVMFTTLQGTVS